MKGIPRAPGALFVGLALVLSYLHPATAAPSCRGHAATITGTGERDDLTGTPGDDVIVGLGGNDEIDGQGGNDVICGGRGNDSLGGGRGKDRIHGDGGSDDLFGASGSDRLHGGPGRDDLAGWFGNDVLAGGDGPDEARFGTFGVTQSRRIVADLSLGSARGEGHDVLRGVEDLATHQFECGCAGVKFIGDDGPNVFRDLGSNYATDIFKGGGGDDVLTANTGPDRFLGGPGDDRFMIGFHNDDEMDGDDVFRGGGGTDTADFSQPAIAPGSVTVDLAAGTATGPQIEIDVLAGFENAIGTPGNDSLNGDDGPNRLRGGDGDDDLAGRDGGDYLDGGAGTNTNDGGDGIDECVNPDSSAGAVACEAP